MNGTGIKVKKLVFSALMAALVYAATMMIQIPSPMNGYVNLGDCFVLLSGWSRTISVRPSCWRPEPVLNSLAETGLSMMRR
mgnify:CR=1 FL=1